MNKTNLILWPAAALLGLSSLSAHAIPSAPDLWDYGINVDGDYAYPFDGDLLPLGVDISLFDEYTGLGSITAIISGAGAHTFDAIFDHDISGDIYNEKIVAVGTPSAGQRYEGDAVYYFYGDIYDNFEASTLDNLVSLDLDDVGMAIGWDFMLEANELATITLSLTEEKPDVDFYLKHINMVGLQSYRPYSNYDVYLTGSLNIECVEDCPTGKVPEPSMLLLMGVGLVGMVATRRRKV